MAHGAFYTTAANQQVLVHYKALGIDKTIKRGAGTFSPEWVGTTGCSAEATSGSKAERSRVLREGTFPRDIDLTIKRHHGSCSPLQQRRDDGVAPGQPDRPPPSSRNETAGPDAAIRGMQALGWGPGIEHVPRRSLGTCSPLMRTSQSERQLRNSFTSVERVVDPVEDRVRTIHRALPPIDRSPKRGKGEYSPLRQARPVSPYYTSNPPSVASVSSGPSVRQERSPLRGNNAAASSPHNPAARSPLQQAGRAPAPLTSSLPRRGSQPWLNWDEGRTGTPESGRSRPSNAEPGAPLRPRQSLRSEASQSPQRARQAWGYGAVQPSKSEATLPPAGLLLSARDRCLRSASPTAPLDAGVAGSDARLPPRAPGRRPSPLRSKSPELLASRGGLQGAPPAAIRMPKRAGAAAPGGR